MGEKGESTFFERTGKKDPSIRGRTKTHFDTFFKLRGFFKYCYKTFFNHCMGDASASLRDFGLCPDLWKKRELGRVR